MSINGDILHPGDVVEARHKAWPGESYIRGPLFRYVDNGELHLCGHQIADHIGTVDRPDLWTRLTIVSRAPRPLYVNHPRTEPVDGDIARDRDGDAWRRSIGRWFMAGGSHGFASVDDSQPLTLLWDGERKQVVQ